MGEVINVSADVDRIAQHVQTTYENALARGGEIAEAAKNRLESSSVAIEKAAEQRKITRKAAAASWALVLGEDGHADALIGSIRDEMWNTLGRPRQSPALDEVFPGGVRIYTAADCRDQPLLMQVLHTRILAASAPQWPEAKRIGWATALETRRTSYATAVDAHRPLEAAETIAEVAYRAAVRTGHARLVSLKRDLKNLGLTEAQIHDIIPDAGKPRGTAAKGEEAKKATAMLPS